MYSMLTLSICIWIVLVYSIKVSVSGNPAYYLVKQTPKLILNEAAACLESEMIPDNKNIYLFIKMFFRLTALACVLFILEFGVLLYFIYTEPKLLIPWFILIKNIVMLALGHSLHHDTNENIFESVRKIPRWAMRWERISYVVTAVCFLYLFLLVNDLFY